MKKFALVIVALVAAGDLKEKLLQTIKNPTLHLSLYKFEINFGGSGRTGCSCARCVGCAKIDRGCQCGAGCVGK